MSSEYFHTEGHQLADISLRLSKASVRRNLNPYLVIEWDSPEKLIDRLDAKWNLVPGDPLAATEWYKGLPSSKKSAIGLSAVCSFMEQGVSFENHLQQGLLQFVRHLDPKSSCARYIYHEIIEESQHSLMFREFNRRAGVQVTTVKETTTVVELATTFPPLFFACVLAGEQAIDYWQKWLLSAKRWPAIMEQVCRLHIQEEARHLSFASAYLRDVVPKLPEALRSELAFKAPILVRQIAQIMLLPYEITEVVPGEVVYECKTSDIFKSHLKESIRRIYQIFEDLGLIDGRTEKLWPLERQP
jgi:hypothetical protein